MLYFNRKGTVDNSLILADGAAAVTADAAGLVAAAAKVVDVGAQKMEGQMIVDVSAFKVSVGDEYCFVKLQGSNTAAFGGTDISDLAILSLGDSAVIPGGSDEGAGLYEVPFVNRKTVDEVMTTFRYLRVYFDVGGTLPSITSTVYLTK